MRVWFSSLPLHRKLIALVLAVSTAASLAAVLGLTLFDIVRFRAGAGEAARALAQVIAENTAAAIAFDDSEAASHTLGSVRVRPAVSSACVYRADGTLLAVFETADARCPVVPASVQSWQTIGVSVPVIWNGRVVGQVYVERTLADLRPRAMVTLAAGGLVLLVAALFAFALASQLQHLISRPIVELAMAARLVGRQERVEIPAIDAPPDETGALVRAFRDMVARLLLSNEALRAEVAERTRIQAERETLLAREREASRLKDEFLAAVSHELRTPLNAIFGWTQVLESTPPSEEMVAKATAGISRNVQAQNRVIQDLLDVSRIITGKMQLSLTAADLRSIVDSTVEVLIPVATAKKLHLEVDVPAVACIAHADYDRIRQVVWNLLSNAIKFTPSGGIVAVRVVDAGEQLQIVVSDSGIGISSEFIDHVFERFRQADGSTTREHGGLGLGLAIVKELTELHGGSVKAESPGVGLGSTFTVTLPRFVGRGDGTTIGEVSGTARSNARLDGVRMLVVDDNPDALEIIATTLTDAGATVQTATSGALALEEAQRQAPDAVLCDLAMPRMDGFEVLSRIRALDSTAGRTTPVFAISAYASAAYQARCLAAGFQGHIAKPIDRRELIELVAAAVVPPAAT